MCVCACVRVRCVCDKEGEREGEEGERANVYLPTIHKAEMCSAVLLKPAKQSDISVYLLQERLGI